ncbi:MAG: hypothetical protein OZ934_08740 [Anaerolineae bacterium]|nr:hypothetical protein [Anaerolineae bacterium]
MIKRLTGQFNVLGKAAVSTLAPSLYRLGFVLLGVIIGLAWAYEGAPVTFRDAEPVHLADGYKDQWIKMTAVEFAQSGDTAEAQRKIVSGGVTVGMIQRLIDDNAADEPGLASQLQALLPIAQQSSAAAALQGDKIKSDFLGGVLGPLACVVGTAVIGLLLALFFTFYWAVPVGKWARSKPVPEVPLGATTPIGPAGAGRAEIVAVKRAAAREKTDFEARGEAPPVGQFVSTYVLGDDLYDDSFSIETAKSEFLGECGSGISETIGVGEPKKVTATEVWLFDKNDIRTVTKVLMSEHAYNDPALRTKLAPKGEAVLARPGVVTALETETLRVQVRIVDMQYGEGPLPPRSFFERLAVEIAAWPKLNSGASSSQPPDTSAAFGDTAELLNY